VLILFPLLLRYFIVGTPYSAEDCATHNPDLQTHKYNGKEFDTTHGLNTYDYGARQYNSLVGRWDRMDPLCEKYYSVSPYAYCLNNPVNAFDPDGKQPVKKVQSDGTIKISWNVVVLNKALGSNVSEKAIQKHQRNVKRREANLLKQFNYFLNGNGKGVKNSKGETIISEFNIISVDVKNPSDKTEARKIAKEYSQEIKEGQSGKHGDAAVIMDGSTNGALGLTIGACLMTIAPDAPDGTESHELYHTTGVGDNGYTQGGILNSPPEPIKPNEVDDMLNLIPEAK